MLSEFEVIGENIHVLYCMHLCCKCFIINMCKALGGIISVIAVHYE